MRKPVAAFVFGLLVGAGAWSVLEDLPYLQTPLPSGAVAHVLQPVVPDPHWIKSGRPVFAALEFAKEPTGQASSGIWTCEGPTTFEWTFHSDEAVYILEGEVHIEYRGQRYVLNSGDSGYFYAETKALWTVPGKLRKAYTLHQPNSLVRWWRRLAGVSG